VPFLNIVEETIAWAQQRVPGVQRVGVLATDGTVRAGTYERWCEQAGLECVLPEPQVQAAVMEMIYDGVKAGRPGHRVRLPSTDRASSPARL
jgi:aspartate racemase